MVKSYFKTAWHSLLRQKVAFIINISCLSTAIGCSIIAYLYVKSNIDREREHINGEHIFLVEHQAVEDGNLFTQGSTPTPLGPAMATDFASVIRTVRIASGPAKVQSGDYEFEERIRFVDPAFMEMFTFPLKYGEVKALYENNSIIISEGTEKKYFGNENSIGRTLLITLPDREGQIFTIRGVLKPGRSKSCVGFSIIVPYENRFETGSNLFNNWNDLTQATFIQVDRPENISRILSRMTKYVKLQNAADTFNIPIKRFQFKNLNDLKLQSGDVRNSIAGHIPWAQFIVLSGIAILVLSLACFNFISVSVASSSARLKEIGIRKIIGANRRQVMWQFLFENALICLLSVLMAVVIARIFLLPAFNAIAGSAIVMDFSGRMPLWLYLSGLLVSMTIASALYPALYVSSFKPVVILRDRTKFTKGGFMHYMLTFQFILTLITMVASVGLTLNAIHLQHRDWGYDKDNVLVVKVDNASQYSLMRKAASEQPDILNVSGASRHVGIHKSTVNAKVKDEEINTIIFEVGRNYFETMGLHFKAGEFPDTRDAVVVNETFARRSGMGKVIGQMISVENVNFSIRGVVKDFHYKSFQADIDPAVFRLGDESEFSYVVMKVQPGTAVSTSTALAKTWRLAFPGISFGYFFQNETFEDMNEDTRGILKIFIFTTTLALLMSCLGLFGLASQRTVSKMKEVCIRKVFGIPVVKAVLLVKGKFLVLLTTAALVSAPVSYYILSALLDSLYSYRMEVGPSPFVISYVLVLVTLVITVVSKIYEIVVSNPADLLRNE